jgi:8-oxo-dGTP diphosphatase
MAIYFVRHAKASSRSAWAGDDHLRPLTTAGRAQAVALAELLGNEASVLLSSPYVRCRETLAPLGQQLGVEVTDHPALSEGMPFEPVLELLSTLPDGAVLCSHGDVIPDTIAALARRGTVLRGQPDWRKASTWVLERNGDGLIVAMSVWAPPTPT